LPVVLAFVAFVSWRMVGRALGPVEVMRAEVADITATRLDRRVPIPAADDEVTRLARTLNDMLDRLQRSDDAQRRFVADASHEMRTPLANMRTALEVARSHPETSTWDDVGADVLDQTARLQRLVDDLLQLAHAEARGDRRTDQPVDLAALAREEAEAPRRVAVEVDAPSAVIIDGNVDQLASAMRNLLDNAARHAEAQVHVVVADRGGAAELVVSDDGPGIASSDRERIFERFVRLDGHRGRAPNDPGGAGVGLAIVRRVALAHGGTAVATDPDGLGGARLVVRIPH
jgi:signal transduction histidine kinase